MKVVGADAENRMRLEDSDARAPEREPTRLRDRARERGDRRNRLRTNRRSGHADRRIRELGVGYRAEPEPALEHDVPQKAIPARHVGSLDARLNGNGLAGRDHSREWCAQTLE